MTWRPSITPDAARVLVVAGDGGRLGRALSAAGHDVRAVSSARSLRHPPGAWRPDVIVMDVDLPHEAGLDVIGTLEGPPPIVILVGLDVAEVQAEARRVGAYAFLEAPVDAQLLADVLWSATCGARLAAPAAVRDVRRRPSRIASIGA